MEGIENHALKSVSVDWLSVTAKSKKPCLNLAERAADLIHDLKGQGHFVRAWGMSGYSGFSCGGVQLGRRNLEVLVRLSGEQAALHWRNFYAMAENVTRLDCQCTSDTGTDPERRITRHLQAARRWSKRHSRKKAIRLIRDYTGGSTIYFGKRASQRFGRCYNKAVESDMDQFQNCVRYEVELKGDLAKLTAHRLARSSQENSLLCGEVTQFFNMYGVSLPFSMVGCERILLPRKRSDFDKRLRWLNKCVGQTCRALIRGNRTDDMLQALGIEVHNGTVRVRGEQSRLRQVG
jgi:DNA relaxase NicK